MIKLTDSAAKQIQLAATQGKLENLPLRIAVTHQEDGSFHYALGFDDTGRSDDIKVSCEGVEIIVAPSSMALLTGTVIDFVEIEPGQHHFIFMNPNDPSYTPPTDEMPN